MPNQPLDWTPYLFLAAMIVIGGLVAWVADGLGRKIGKKRLSFMGLRPRYTATLLTVGAGVVIPILTIAAIYGLSSEVREWVREGRGAIRRAQLNQEKANQEAERASGLEKKSEGLQKEITNRTKLVESLRKQLATYQKEAAGASQRRAEAEARANQAKAQAQSLQKRVASADVQINSKKQEIAQTKALLSKNKKDLASLQGSYNIAAADFRDLNDRAIKLDTQNAELEKKLGTLQQDLGGLQEQKRQYLVQIDSYEQSVKAYQDSIKTYTDKIAALSAQADQLQSELRVNLQTNIASRTRPLIFEAEEELVRVQLPPSLSPQAARSAYFDLLQRLRAAALERKALNDPNDPPAGLIPRPIGNRIRSVAEQEAAIIRDITSQRDELILTALAEFNAFEGEYVIVKFIALKNRMVYPQGTMIVEKRIDGRGSQFEVITQIQDFIGTNLRARALRDGMVPPAGRNGQLGKIDTEELLKLSREIMEFDQPVRLQALAKSDTMAGDQLDVYFRVRL